MLGHQGASRLTQRQGGGQPWVASHGPISAPLEVEAQLQNELVSVIPPSLSSKQQTMSTLTLLPCSRPQEAPTCPDRRHRQYVVHTRC